MRIEFPHSAKAGFHWNQALLRVGSEPDNDLVLAAGQAAAHHLRIRLDRRGWVLEVLPEATRVYVNARPVRERALLRPGDVLSVGDCRMLLCADDAPESRASPEIPELDRCTVAMRAVAGPYSGQVLTLSERLELSPQGLLPLDLPQGGSATLALFWRDGQLRLETGQSPESRYPVRVNGVTVQQTVLLPGDQVGIGMHRFMIDAPGMEPEPEIVIPEPPPKPVQQPVTSQRGEIGWLIVTAAVIALVIAWLLLKHF